MALTSPPQLGLRNGGEPTELLYLVCCVFYAPCNPITTTILFAHPLSYPHTLTIDMAVKDTTVAVAKIVGSAIKDADL